MDIDPSLGDNKPISKSMNVLFPLPVVPIIPILEPLII
jgi:hypothetical protein